jgi:hypothetical protein
VFCGCRNRANQSPRGGCYHHNRRCGCTFPAEARLFTRVVVQYQHLKPRTNMEASSLPEIDVNFVIWLGCFRPGIWTSMFYHVTFISRHYILLHLLGRLRHPQPHPPPQPRPPPQPHPHPHPHPGHFRHGLQDHHPHLDRHQMHLD